MIEILNQSVQWWWWIVLGVVLLIAEMGTGTFVLFALSVASVITGLTQLIFHTPFIPNMVIWIILSSIFIFIWQKYFHNPTHSDTGQSSYGTKIGGVVTEDIEQGHRGEVALDEPLVGNRTWTATANKRIPKGSRIKIIEIKGHLLEVEPA